MKVPAMIAAELRRLTASKMAVLALIALMCVPILYGGLYLWANQDPYGRFSEVPVALVVEDEGATSDNGDGTQENVNYGEEVAKDLVEGNAFDWKEMSAEKATSALKDGSVDFTVTIPKDFSDALTSSSGTEPRQAGIDLETNDANNYLASSMGTQAVEKIRASVAQLVGSEAAERLLTGLSDIRAKLSDAASGASQLVDGTTSASEGSVQLADGTSQLASGASQLASGASQVASGATQLASGTGQLASGAAQLADGAQQVSDGDQQLAQVADRAGSAVQQAADALPQVRSDISAALTERGLSSAEVDAILARLDPIATRLQEGNATVQAAVGKVDQLAAGAATLASSARELANGASTVASGANDLASGAGSVSDGAGSVATGASAADAGAAQLRDGLSTIVSGTTQLRDGLDDGVAAIPDSTAELRKQQADTISDPVKVSSDKVASAEDYGAGLAPFFAALAGWIGIYALFLIVKPISRRAVTALHSPIRVTLAGWLTPALLGALQMVGLMAVLAITLGFQFNNPLGTLGILVLASATFTAIILTLNVWLGSVGQFLGLVLMVLQLVTAGGTFPWQTLPPALGALHHVLPMGFVVDAMRQLMYGGDMTRLGGDIAVLGAWLCGALALALIGVTRMTRRRTLRDLQPSLIG